MREEAAEQVRDVAFPDELVGSRVVINAASGAGKTYVLRRILEETHGRLQHLVLDVEDELFTLRERFDYLLIGGDGADAPISETNAGELARTLLELGVSAIIQLNDLGLAGQRRVIGAFVAGLMAAPRALWHPVLVTLDEAHRYAPQSAPVASTEALVNLATSGRKRGFGAVFATQRLSQLSKDILGQCPNRIIGRVDQALDRRAAADVLGFAPSSREAKELMRLRHDFWIVGPALAPEPVLHRFAPALTTHLQAGNRNVPSPPTPARLRTVLSQLAALATSPADEGRATEKRGSTGRVSEATKAPRDDAAVATARADGSKEGFAAGDAAGFQRGLEEGRRRGISEAMAAADEALSELLDTSDREEASEVGQGPSVPTPQESVRPARAIPAPAEAGEAAMLGSAQQRVLDALAWLRAARIPEPGRNQVGWAAGYRADTGHFGNVLSELAGAGLIDRPRPGVVVLTEAGAERAVAPKGRLTSAVLVDRIKAKLSGPASKVLDALVAAYPAARTREELGQTTGYRPDAGHFGNVISELAGPEIVTRPRPGEVRLADWVMLR